MIYCFCNHVNGWNSVAGVRGDANDRCGTFTIALGTLNGRDCLAV